jgi:hypothetical protein
MTMLAHDQVEPMILQLQPGGQQKSTVRNNLLHGASGFQNY